MHHYPYSFSPKLMIHYTIFTPIVEKKDKKGWKTNKPICLCLSPLCKSKERRKFFFWKSPWREKRTDVTYCSGERQWYTYYKWIYRINNNLFSTSHPPPLTSPSSFAEISWSDMASAGVSKSKEKGVGIMFQKSEICFSACGGFCCCALHTHTHTQYHI